MKITTGCRLLFVAVSCLGLETGHLRADSIGVQWPDPGTPQSPGSWFNSYGSSYTWDAGGPFGDDPLNDPGFVAFLQAGAFFQTGNTSFHFTGTPEITLWSYTAGAGGGAPSPSNKTPIAPAPVPEPAPFWLVICGLVSLSVPGYFKARRFRALCKATSSGTDNCSARLPI